MRNGFSKIALAAGFGLALVFTLSCEKRDKDDDDEENNSGTEMSSSDGISVSSSSSDDAFVGNNGEFIDNRDNQTYKWVKIGTQTWMAQNLNYHEEWIGPTRGNKCYNNIDANCDKYGRLYEWDDAIRLCPDGWHLPTNAEWNILVSFVGDDAGKKLRSNSNDWGNDPGIDSYGFGALPGGAISNGNFAYLNTEGTWWTSTEYNAYNSIERYMRADNEVREYSALLKTNQLSIRCVKGASASSSITYGKVTDMRDNKEYKTVKIGNQNWMAENLNYAGTDDKIGSCYDNETENCNIYGRLYDWATSMGVSINYNSERLNAPIGLRKGICPEGWHLPTKEEWDVLIDSVGDDAGKKLRARSSEWGDNYGTNIYGFGALPGGGLDYDLSSTAFANINKHGNWWTSTESTRGDLDRSHIKSMTPNFEEFYGTKAKGYSIRCVEND